MKRALFLLALFSCSETNQQVRDEADDLRNMGIRAELSAARDSGSKSVPTSPESPTCKSTTPECERLLKVIKEAGGRCAVELQQVEGRGGTCTESTCPECKRLEDARAEAKTAGC